MTATLLLCIAFVAGLPVLASEAYRPGVPWTGSRGIQKTTGELSRASGGKRLPLQERFKPGHGPGHPADNPESPTVPSWPPMELSTNNPLGGISNAFSPQSFSLNFTGATLAETHSYPPDSMGAAGPSQFIVAVNGRFRSFNKSTGLADGILDVDPDTFYSSVMTPPLTNNFTSDPRIRYDRLSDRWFIIMIDVPGRAGLLPNRILIAVSGAGVITPSTTWTFFQFEQDLVSPLGDTGDFADYPTLGVDANALYVGVNIFNTSGSLAFANTTAFVIRKSSVLGTGPIIVTAFRSLIGKVRGVPTGPFTPQGVDNFDPAATEGYLIGVDAGFYGKLQLRRISNPGTTPSISGNIALTTPSTGGPLNVPHLGNSGGTAGLLDAVDYRLMQAHARNGHIWTTQNIAVDNTGVGTTTSATRDGVRWYEIQGIATGSTPTLVQSGTIFQRSASNTTDQRYYWMGTVMTSGQGHAAFGFSTAGVNEYANCGVAGRLISDALGTTQPAVLYTSANTAYNPVDANNNPINRWGDYSCTTVDPSDDMTLWTIQEFCNGTNSYAVQILKLLAPPPALPISCLPNSVLQGATNIILNIAGLSTNGSGFFDPGAGFPNHITAAVNGGGVTVNSISFSNATNISLNISVDFGAATGLRSISATNPDGQFVVSAPLLAISNNAVVVVQDIPNQTIPELSLWTFAVTAVGPAGATLAYSLSNAPAGMIINGTNGLIAWTPSEVQGPGTNTVTVIVTDNGSPASSASTTFLVVVIEVNSPPTLAPISNQSIHAGMTLTLTNSATDPDIPTNTLTFALLVGSGTGAIVDSNTGIFTWMPTDTEIGTNHFLISVTDNGVPPLSATNAFSVLVESRPALSAAISGTNVLLNWAAIPGVQYHLQFKTNLNDLVWTGLMTTTATGLTATATDTVSTDTKFYELLLP